MSGNALEDLQAAALTIKNLGGLDDPSARGAIPAVRRVFDEAAGRFAQELTTLFGIYVKPPRARTLAFTMDFGRDGGRQAIATAEALWMRVDLEASPARRPSDGTLDITPLGVAFYKADTEVALRPDRWPNDWKKRLTGPSSSPDGSKSVLDGIKENIALANQAIENDLTGFFGFPVKAVPGSRDDAFIMDLGAGNEQNAKNVAILLNIYAKLEAATGNTRTDPPTLQRWIGDRESSDTLVVLYPKEWPENWKNTLREPVRQLANSAEEFFDSDFTRCYLDVIKENLAAAAEANSRKTAAPTTPSVPGAAGPQAF